MPTADSPLRIVHVVRSDAFAGVERYICQVANALVERGHTVVAVGGDPGRMRDELADPSGFRPAATVWEAARALAGERSADIVHVHMTAAESAAWLVRPLLRAPIVATRHFAKDRGSSPPSRLVARITSRSISRDIAISRFVADSISGPSVLIPTGVPEAPAAALDSATVVMLQRLSAEKSPELGIEAWSASGLGGRGWRLVIAGAGERAPSLARLAAALDVAGSIDFVGQVADTGTLLSDASILLAPSSVDGFGLAVVEAMAHGVPVVAADGGGHAETVGPEGMLFPPGDAGAAGRALAALGGDPALRRRVGPALRARQQERYSLSVHCDALEALYYEVVRESSHPAARR